MIGGMRRRSFVSSSLAMLVCAGDLFPQSQVWVCPMDPDVRQNTPGLCKRCNMKLVDRIPEATEYHMDLTTSPASPLN